MRVYIIRTRLSGSQLLQYWKIPRNVTDIMYEDWQHNSHHLHVWCITFTNNCHHSSYPRGNFSLQLK